MQSSMVFLQVKMPVDTEGWRAGIVNNKFNYIYHSKRSHHGSILNFYLSTVAPKVSTICYLYFFILVSVLSLPLPDILSFIFNISVLKHFWFLIVCLPDEGMSHDFINNLAIIINFIQTAVLLLKARVISILFSIH